MTQRSILMVFILSIVTLGLYLIYWLVVTKNEMVSQGADIPSAILLIIPVVNIWWMWKYCQGVEYISNKGLTAGVAFLLYIFIGFIAVLIFQNEFNKAAKAGPPVSADVFN